MEFVKMLRPGIYERTEEIIEKYRKARIEWHRQNPGAMRGENSLCYGKTVEELGHKIDCRCFVCKVKRGETKGENHPFYGKTHTDEAKRKNSEFKKNKTYEEIYGEEVAREKKEKHRKRWMGEKNPNYGRDMKGKNNPNWQNGASEEPYGPEWNSELRLFIRQRDDFICQFCGAKENGRAFPVHHIDSNKKNNNNWNLVLLCNIHNSEAKSNKEKWEFFFQTLQEIRQC